MLGFIPTPDNLSGWQREKYTPYNKRDTMSLDA